MIDYSQITCLQRVDGGDGRHHRQRFTLSGRQWHMGATIASVSHCRSDSGIWVPPSPAFYTVIPQWHMGATIASVLHCRPDSGIWAAWSLSTHRRFTPVARQWHDSGTSGEGCCHLASSCCAPYLRIRTANRLEVKTVLLNSLFYRQSKLFE